MVLIDFVLKAAQIVNICIVVGALWDMGQWGDGGENEALPTRTGQKGVEWTTRTGRDQAGSD